MPAPLRVALIGCGGIARDQHLPGWAKVSEARVVAAADPSPAALAAVEREFGVRRLETDYRPLLDDPSIDVVDVCAPSALHSEVTVAALLAGKHVLCEKPMATSRAGAAAMLEASRKSGRRLMISQHMRFEPTIQQLLRHLQRQPLGDVYYTRGQWLRRRRLPGRPGFVFRDLSGGGALYDLGVHLLDLAWWIQGCPLPESVSGATSNHLARRGDLTSEWGAWDPATIDVEDFAVGLIRFAGGRTMGLEVSWLGLQPEREFWRLQLYGTEAGLIWPDNVFAGENNSVPWDTQLTPPLETEEKPHHTLIQHFTNVVLHGAPSYVRPEQSATCIAILEALYASAASGHEVQVEPFPSATAVGETPLAAEPYGL